MRLSKNLLCGAALTLCASQAAQAEDTTFVITQDVLNYNMTSTETTPKGGTASTVKHDDLESMANSLRFTAVVGPYSFYVYPTRPDMPLSLGMYLNRNLEVGANLYLSMSDEDKPLKKAKSRHGLGAYAVYYQEVGTSTVEYLFSPNYLMEGSTTAADTTAGTAEVKEETNTMSLIASASYVMPLSKRFSYIAGLEFNYNAVGVEKPLKVDVKQTVFKFNLASFRYTF